jgi:hypothetical protein
MKYAVEMGSGAMVYIPSFITIGSSIQEWRGGYTYKHTHTHTQAKRCSHTPTFIFQNKENRPFLRLLWK